MQPAANQEFKDAYPRRFRRALAAAVPLGVLSVALLPSPQADLPDLVPSGFTVIDLQEVMDTPPTRSIIERPVLPKVQIREEVVDVVLDTPLKEDAVAAAPAATTDEPTLTPYDVAPRPISMARPVFPRSARAAGVEGEVTVRMRVDTRGRVESVAVLESSLDIFEPSTLAALRAWRFIPARKDGRSVPASIEFTIQFVLVDREPDPAPVRERRFVRPRPVPRTASPPGSNQS